MLTEIISAHIDEKLTLLVAHWIQPSPVTYCFNTNKPLWYIKAINCYLISRNPSKPKFFKKYQNLANQYLRIDSAIMALQVVEHIELYKYESDILFKDFLVFFHLFLSAAWDYQQLIDQHLVNPPSGLEFNIPKEKIYQYEIFYYHKSPLELKDSCHTKALGIWEFSQLLKVKEE